MGEWCKCGHHLIEHIRDEVDSEEIDYCKQCECESFDEVGADPAEGRGEEIDSFCFARDDGNEYRKRHKPEPGKYDGEDILSCAWCGKTLTGDKEGERD